MVQACLGTLVILEDLWAPVGLQLLQHPSQPVVLEGLEVLLSLGNLEDPVVLEIPEILESPDLPLLPQVPMLQLPL